MRKRNKLILLRILIVVTHEVGYGSLHVVIITVCCVIQQVVFPGGWLLSFFFYFLLVVFVLDKRIAPQHERKELHAELQEFLRSLKEKD